ncbi:MAG: PAS domain S-box protein [Zoogloea sp.]|nr:PAS domain S-box protein [Zoogloea sp.]
MSQPSFSEPLLQYAGEAMADISGRLVDVLFSTLPLGLVLFDRQGRCLRVNPVLAQMNGLPAEKHVGRRATELFAELGRRVEACVARVLASGESLLDVDLEGEVLARPGQRSEWVSSYHAVPGDGAGPEGVLAIVRNVTESRSAKRMLAESEQNMRLSEERFRQVVESVPDGLVMVDADGRIALVNAGMERMFGYRRTELIGRPIGMLIPEPERDGHQFHMRAFLGAPAARDMGAKRELHARRKDGSAFPVEVALNPILAASGPLVLATVVDIAERKAGQAMIERALLEKTALLNEVHHRVKNNLQVISSLLNLQARHATEEARAVLSESQGRVKAMALIHQLLYERNDFSRVDLGFYLQRLCSLLRESLSVDSGRIKLCVEVDRGGVALDLQRAVPCGLLVNELVANAMKHAFPGHRRGKVTVRLQREEDGRGRITVADDGVGLPPGLEFSSSRSLGFQLVPLLVDQIGGELVLTREPGTTFEIRFTAGGRGPP